MRRPATAFRIRNDASKQGRQRGGPACLRQVDCLAGSHEHRGESPHRWGVWNGRCAAALSRGRAAVRKFDAVSGLRIWTPMNTDERREGLDELTRSPASGAFQVGSAPAVGVLSKADGNARVVGLKVASAIDASHRAQCLNCLRAAELSGILAIDLGWLVVEGKALASARELGAAGGQEGSYTGSRACLPNRSFRLIGPDWASIRVHRCSSASKGRSSSHVSSYLSEEALGRAREGERMLTVSRVAFTGPRRRGIEKGGDSEVHAEYPDPRRGRRR
jgi:hypothetical protein